jgi:hypothetical protein
MRSCFLDFASAYGKPSRAFVDLQSGNLDLFCLLAISNCPVHTRNDERNRAAFTSSLVSLRGSMGSGESAGRAQIVLRS